MADGAENTALKVPVVNEYGQFGTMDQAEAKQALQEGYRIPSNEEWETHLGQEKFGSGVVNPLLAAGAGAARGFTFGGSDVALRGLGVPAQTLSGLEKFNPYASGAGEAVGVGAGLLTGEGEVAGAAKGAGEAAHLLNPVKTVAGIGKGVSEAVAPAGQGLASLLVNKASSPIAHKIVSQIPSAMAGSAVEGAFYGAGQSVSEAALGDSDLGAEKIASNIGYSALIGGGLGGLFKTAEIGVPAVVQKAQSATKKLTEKLGSIFPEYAAKLSAQVSGKSAEDIKPLLEGFGTEEGMKMRENAIEGFAEKEKTARELTESLSSHVDSMQNASKEFNLETRKEEISKLLAGVPVEKAFSSAADLSGKLGESIKEMEARPAIYSPYYPAKLRDINHDFQTQLSKAASSEDVFNAVNEARSNISKYSKFEGVPSPAEKDAILKVKDSYFDFQKHLVDSSIYGEGAARQAAVADAISEHIDAQKELLKQFGKKSGKIQKVDAGKVMTFLNQVGRPAGDAKQAALDAYMESSQNLSKQMGESSQHSIKKIDTDKLLDLHQKTQDIAAGAESELDAANKYKRLTNFGEKHHGAGEAVGAGLVAHAVGLPGSLVAGAYGVYNTLKEPSALVRHLSTLERTIQKTNNIVSRGTKAIFEVGAKEAGKFSGYIGSKLTPDDRQKNYSKLMNKVNQMNNDLPNMVDTIHKSTDPIKDSAPNISQGIEQASARATQFLASKSPQPPQSKPLSNPLEPSPAELAKFYRYVDAVEKPTIILDQIKSGTITAEAAEAVKSVYPKLYQNMQSSVLNELTTHLTKGKAIPYKTKLSLSLFMGSDLVDSLSQQNISSNQIAQAKISAESQQSDQSMMKPKRSESGMSKLKGSERMLTSMQAISQRNEV